MSLWGNKPHSLLAVFDRVSPKDKLQNSQLAMKLMQQKPSLKKPAEVMEWIKQAMSLLGQAQNLLLDELQGNEHVKLFRAVASGELDNQTLGTILFSMENSADSLEDDKLLSGKVAEIAHAAISHWAALEVKQNVW